MNCFPRLALALLVALLLAGCSSYGLARFSERTTTTTPTGEQTTTVRQVDMRTPPNPAEAGVIELGGTDFYLIASSGRAYKVDQALRQLRFIPYVGVALILFGVLSLTLKSWPLLRFIPFASSIPFGTSLGIMALGAALIPVPMLADRYSLLLLLSGAGAIGFGVAYFAGGLDNFRTRKPDPQPTSIPEAAT